MLKAHLLDLMILAAIQDAQSGQHMTDAVIWFAVCRRATHDEDPSAARTSWRRWRLYRRQWIDWQWAVVAGEPEKVYYLTPGGQSVLERAQKAISTRDPLAAGK